MSGTDNLAQGADPEDNNRRLRKLKRERYAFEEFGQTYDLRYASGLNRLNTAVERAWIGRCLTGRGPVLDAGAGTGRLAVYLHARGQAILALDSSQAMLDSIGGKDPGIPRVRAEVYCLPLATASLEATVCLHVLFHLPDWRAVLTELARVVRPGGQVIFELRSGEHVRLAGKALACLGLTRPERQGGGPTLETFHATRKEVFQAMREAGLAPVKVLAYDLGHSYYLKFLSGWLDRLFAGSGLVCRAVASLELFCGRFLPAGLAYRCLYSGRKK